MLCIETAQRGSLLISTFKSSSVVIFYCDNQLLLHPFPRKWSIRDASITHPTLNVSSIRPTSIFLGSPHLRDAHFCNNYTKVALIFAHLKHSFCTKYTNMSDPGASQSLSKLVSSRHSYTFHPTAQPILYTLINLIQRLSLSLRRSFL